MYIFLNHFRVTSSDFRGSKCVYIETPFVFILYWRLAILYYIHLAKYNISMLALFAVIVQSKFKVDNHVQKVNIIWNLCTSGHKCGK